MEPLHHKEFLKWLETLDIPSCKKKVPICFDHVYINPLEDLRRFTQSKIIRKSLHTLIKTNEWSIDESGKFFVKTNSFHGAVSMMSYIIDTFCTPRDIILDGTIVGVNAVYPLVYVYRISENDIEIDVESTHTNLLYYETILGEPTASSQMLQKLCEEEEITP